MIRFLQPVWLLSAAPVLLLVGAYVWRALRRGAYARRFTSVDLSHSVTPSGVGWRRRLPSIAFVLALLVLSAALTRPYVNAKTPRERATIMLAIDESLSMKASDVQPSRIRAAQSAATEFVTTLPRRFNIGVVAFAEGADVLVSPTKDHSAIVRAIDGLRLGPFTATGDAVFTCLSAIRSVPDDGAPGPPPARIVLLSDGNRTSGRPVDQAALAAATARVPVSTIAFGTDRGTVTVDGLTQSVPVDRPALRVLAQQTSGHFYSAVSPTQLHKVYQRIGSSIAFKTGPREVTQWFAGLATLFTFTSAGLRLLWTSRLI